MCVCVCAQLYLTLRHPVDCSPPGSSVQRILQQGHWSGVPAPSPGGLPDARTEPASPASPALAAGFFTAGATWECTDVCYWVGPSLFGFPVCDRKTPVNSLANTSLTPPADNTHLGTGGCHSADARAATLSGSSAWPAPQASRVPPPQAGRHPDSRPHAVVFLPLNCSPEGLGRDSSANIFTVWERSLRLGGCGSFLPVSVLSLTCEGDDLSTPLRTDTWAVSLSGLFVNTAAVNICAHVHGRTPARFCWVSVRLEEEFHGHVGCVSSPLADDGKLFARCIPVSAGVLRGSSFHILTANSGCGQP